MADRRMLVVAMAMACGGEATTVEEDAELELDCPAGVVYATQDPGNACNWAWEACWLVSECRTWTQCLEVAPLAECQRLAAEEPLGAGDEFQDLSECACVGPEKWE